jgi:hypothetical protein
MKANTTDPTVSSYPCLMKRKTDDAVVIVTHGDKGLYQVTLLEDHPEMGTSWTTHSPLDNYYFLPAGFQVTLTN